LHLQKALLNVYPYIQFYYQSSLVH
jgi:hypothetical protein